MRKRKDTIETVTVDSPSINTADRITKLINKSYDAVEKRIDEGTATAQELCYFLKLGSQREQKEMLILESQAKLYNAKTEALASVKHTEELYNEAIKAMRSYSGYDGDNNETDIF